MTRYEEIFDGFLLHQQEQGLKLADDSDLLELFPLGNSPAQRYIARYSCRGLIRTAEGEIQEADRFEVGIYFDREYLRRVGPQVLTWLGPREVFHPNISDRAPVVCIGAIRPANPLVDLLYELCSQVAWAGWDQPRGTPAGEEVLDLPAGAVAVTGHEVLSDYDTVDGIRQVRRQVDHFAVAPWAPALAGLAHEARFRSLQTTVEVSGTPIGFTERLQDWGPR